MDWSLELEPCPSWPLSASSTTQWMEATILAELASGNGGTDLRAGWGHAGGTPRRGATRALHGEAPTCMQLGGQARLHAGRQGLMFFLFFFVGRG